MNGKAKIELPLSKKIGLIWIAAIFIFEQTINFLSIKNGIGIINADYFLGLKNLPNFFSFVLFALLFVFGLGLYKKNYFASTLLLAGASSNIVDRIFRKGVVDYLVLTIPTVGIKLVFNIADILLIVGLLIYASSIFRHK